jgi:hypothetical protein
LSHFPKYDNRRFIKIVFEEKQYQIDVIAILVIQITECPERDEQGVQQENIAPI